MAHRAQNTLRMDRHAHRLGELEVHDGIGDPPEYLHEPGKQEWTRLAQHPQYGRALTSLDRDGFTEYCWLHARLAMEISGIEHDTLRPLSASDSQRLHSLRMQLGLTPASRSKITLPTRPVESKWQKLAALTPSGT